MNRRFLSPALLACTLSLGMHGLKAWAKPDKVNFGVISPPFLTLPNEFALRETIAQSNQSKLAFVLANGIKASTEPCSDSLYQRRKSLLNNVQNSLIVSITANDWTGCKNAQGKPSEIGRLNRLRELFFADDTTPGDNKITMARQSDIAKFRGYPENARWEVSNILFATINLPSDNNHYLHEAGRNSEFEDRAVANRDWLTRLFTVAKRKKMAGIVLFCDGNPLSVPSRSKINSLKGRRDGFIEVRQQLNELTRKFPGKVLLIHGQNQEKPDTSADIVWQGKIGTMGLSSGWAKLTVTRRSSTLFNINHDRTIEK